MQIDKALLASRILDFLVVLHRCLNETTYTQDRPTYASDIATAVGWLVKLHQCEAPDDVAKVITDSSTTKSFTDYWRQGHWGDLEARALNDLQSWIRSIIGG